MPAPQITIRAAIETDAPGLCELGKITFYDTYGAYNTEENMRAYVVENYEPGVMAKALADPETFYYIAFDRNAFIGFLKLRTTKIPEQIAALAPIEIERIYVLPEYKGKGIGHLLMKTAMHVALKNKHKAIWLGVWEKNESAMNFYLKEGFEKMGQHVFMLGDDAQTDWLLYKKIH